jgi:hypothetical protein
VKDSPNPVVVEKPHTPLVFGKRLAQRGGRLRGSARRGRCRGGLGCGLGCGLG